MHARPEHAPRTAGNDRRPVGLHAAWTRTSRSSTRYLKYLKFGFGRVTDQVCEAINAGAMTREEGLELVRRYDGKCDRSFITPLLRIPRDHRGANSGEVAERTAIRNVGRTQTAAGAVPALQMTARNDSIVIVDYGMGNIGSVVNAFAGLGDTLPRPRTSPALRGARGIVLPGVGAFTAAMAEPPRASASTRR